MKLLSLLCWMPFLFACGAKTSEDPGDNGGNTNWLKSCDEDAECGDGDGMCVAEVCLKPCSDDDACDGINDTECRSIQAVTTTPDACGTSAATSLCALRCGGDADCSELGDSYGCNDGVCVPTCPDPTPAPGVDAGSNPSPNPPGEDECVMAMDVSQCCPDAFATRRSELEMSECWYEVVDGDYAQPSGFPEECFLPSCPTIPCPEMLNVYSAAVEDDAGSCIIEPACNDASCPGSACDPGVGCDRDWVEPLSGLPGLQCQATACDEPGVCVYVLEQGCGEIYTPVCGCDGVTYDNPCSAGEFAPILHEGECEPAPSTPADDECVVAMDVSQCCSEAFAARRSELEASECWYEVVDGDYRTPGGFPDACYPSCVDLPCPPIEAPGWYGVASEDATGSCVLEPVCDDASCPGSACDPAVGCDREWVEPLNGLPGLQCQATACGEPGVCVYAQSPVCDAVYDPVCGCDGVTHDNRCTSGDLSPILHEGECEPASE